VGHAIETVTDFNVSHGQAVAIGMLAAALIACEIGVFELSNVVRLRKLLRRAGLMTRMPKAELSNVLTAITRDKKVADGKIKFVLPRAIGDVFITDEVSMTLVEKVLVSLK
jgi:3-dehydroquinate synthase